VLLDLTDRRRLALVARAKHQASPGRLSPALAVVVEAPTTLLGAALVGPVVAVKAARPRPRIVLPGQKILAGAVVAETTPDSVRLAVPAWSLSE